MRVVLLLLILGCPLGAVTFAGGPGEGGPVVQELRADISVHAQQQFMRADYTCTLLLFNPGEGGEFRLVLPSSSASELSVAGRRLPGEQRQGGRTEWRVQIPSQGRVRVVCSSSLTPRRLPHLHVLGLWRTEYPLHRVRGFAGYPEAAEVSVHWHDMAAECFGGEQGTNSRSESVPIESHPVDIPLEWKGASIDQREAELRAQIAQVEDNRRKHTNRAYTEALVALADVLALKADQQGVADTCAELIKLETEGGAAITHCGPWAKWRKHVPWRLRRLEALDALGRGADEAKAIADAIVPLWDAYLKAKGQIRPLEDFGPEKYGNYWDYDWPRVRSLYARALELAGETERAAAIREGGE
jgi:hypothetical protein